MSLYDVALAAHVAGVAGVFLAFGAWLYGTMLLGRARRLEQVWSAMELIDLSEPFIRAGGIVLALTGLYMAIGTWGLTTGWIIAGIAGVLVVGVLGGVVMEPRVKAIDAEAKTTAPGPIPADLAARLHDPLLAVSVRVDVALLFGIVVVMTAKPELVFAVAMLATAAFIGLGWATVANRSAMRKEPA